MSGLSKMKKRLQSLPRDYEYRELRTLLTRLGFEELNKGKTSGSRVKFFRQSDEVALLVHKPHPDNIMKVDYIKDIVEALKSVGSLD